MVFRKILKSRTNWRKSRSRRGRIRVWKKGRKRRMRMRKKSGVEEEE